MFSFFKKKTPLPQLDFSVLGTDMHSHLIPGIDDGAPDLETSLELIKALQTMGFSNLITTPHVMTDLYPNTSEIILKGLNDLQKAIEKAGMEITLSAAAEYLMDEAFGAKIEEENLLTLPGKRVLVEMSFVAEPPNLHDYLFRLQSRGYKPVLAHPERYLFYRGDLKKYERLKDYGCEFQINLLSSTGYYGKPIKETTRKLFKAGLIDFLGTDLHNNNHAELLNKGLKDPFLQQLLNTTWKNTQLQY